MELICLINAKCTRLKVVFSLCTREKNNESNVSRGQEKVQPALPH